jgi:uncharacterized repeat protein (TIGR01451 family)
MPTPAPESATVDLTTSGNFGTIGGTVFSNSLLQPAGSGTFVQIQGGPTEQGYNTNFRPQQFDEKNSAPHNHALLLASVPIVEGDGSNGTVEGLLYREFVLDINEPNGQSRNFLSLDALQIYQAEAGNLTGFHQPLQQGGNGTGFGANATLIYDLDAGGDGWIALNDGSGSGGGDARVLIPNLFFDENTPYVILYSAFGYQGASWASQGGFEEWGTRGPQGNVPALNIVMTGSVPGGTADSPGEVITYAITVRNMGNVSLTGVTVDDSVDGDLTRGADVVGDDDNVLEVGEIWSYTAHHTVTQAEINSGGVIVNTATADSNQTGPDSATVSTTVERAAQIALVVQPDVTSVDAAGDVINYTVTLENTGSTTLTNPVVSDAQLVPVLNFDAPIVDPNVHVFSSINNGDFNLGDTNENNIQDPGETFQYVYPGDITQDGVHDPGETWVAFNLGDIDRDGVHDAGETWVGDSNQNGIEEPGERWQFQNLGDTNHNNLQDPGETWQYANVGDTNQNGVEDPGETFAFRNVGDTDQDGLEDAGETFQFYNAGDTNQNGEEDPGETFQFTTVFQPLAGVDADTNGFNDGDADSDGVLDPGEIWLYVGPTHVVTQAEIDNGGVVDPDLSIDRTVTASTDQTDVVSATASVAVVQTPDVTVLNDAVGGTYDDLNLNGRPDAGETISYAFTVTNSGNMTLFDLDVADDNVTISGMTIASLAPNASDGTTFTGSYVIQQVDIDAGLFTNTSTVIAAAGAPGGFSVSDEDAETVVLPQDPSVAVAMTASIPGDDDDVIDSPLDDVTYTITIVNDGNVTLHDVDVDTSLSASPMTHIETGGTGINGDDILDVGETWTYTTTYDVVQSDIDNGGVVDDDLSIDNTATVTTAQTDPDTASASVDVDQNPAVTLDVAGSLDDGANNRPDAGETISYTFTVTNSGNMTLFGVNVTDPDVDVSGTPITSLAPGASNNTAFTGSYAIEQADIDAGEFNNTSTANAHAGAPGGPAVSASDDETVDLPQHVQMLFEKIGEWIDADMDGIAEEGEVIEYTFRIENTGNVTLTEIGVSDTLGDVIVFGSNIPSLAPGAVDDTTWSATHEITNADVDAGLFRNTATALSLEMSTSASSTVLLPDGSSEFAMSAGGDEWSYKWAPGSESATSADGEWTYKLPPDYLF